MAGGAAGAWAPQYVPPEELREGDILCLAAHDAANTVDGHAVCKVHGVWEQGFVELSLQGADSPTALTHYAGLFPAWGHPGVLGVGHLCAMPRSYSVMDWPGRQTIHFDQYAVLSRGEAPNMDAQNSGGADGVGSVLVGKAGKAGGNNAIAGEAGKNDSSGDGGAQASSGAEGSSGLKAENELLKAKLVTAKRKHLLRVIKTTASTSEKLRAKVDLKALADAEEETDGTGSQMSGSKGKKQKISDPLGSEDESSQSPLFHLAPSAQGQTVKGCSDSDTWPAL